MRGAAKAIGADFGDLCRALLSDAGNQHYARARSARAHVFAESIDDVAEQVLSGEISPEQGRVALDAKKWVAARILKRTYGDTQPDRQVGGVIINVVSAIPGGVEIGGQAGHVAPIIDGGCSGRRLLDDGCSSGQEDGAEG